MRSHSCPKCQGAMAQGFIADTTSGRHIVARWIAGEPEKSIWTGVKLRGKTAPDAQTWRGSRCGHLESYGRI